MHLSDVGHINFNCKKLEIDMKVMCKLFTLVMFITVVTFVQSCGGGGGGAGGSAGVATDGVTVSTETPVSAETPVVPAEEVDILELNGYLSEKSENTKESAYRIKITGLTTANCTKIKTILQANPKKYTDLSATTLPDGITNMAKCFQGCISLTEAPKIPNSVTDMSYCFANCTSLTQALEISNSVTNMAGCFSGCTSLKTVELTIDSWWETCFSGCSAIVSITVPTENIKNSIINASGNDIVKDKIVVKP